MTSEPGPSAFGRDRTDSRTTEVLRILGRAALAIARFTLTNASAYGYSLWATPPPAVDAEPLTEDEILWLQELQLDAVDQPGKLPQGVDSTAWWLFWP